VEDQTAIEIRIPILAMACGTSALEVTARGQRCVQRGMIRGQSLQPPQECVGIVWGSWDSWDPLSDLDLRDEAEEVLQIVFRPQVLSKTWIS
jgi:hypothetical protein